MARSTRNHPLTVEVADLVDSTRRPGHRIVKVVESLPARNLAHAVRVAEHNAAGHLHLDVLDVTGAQSRFLARLDVVNHRWIDAYNAPLITVGGADASADATHARLVDARIAGDRRAAR